MPDDTYAGYRLQARRPAPATDVQHWSAVGTSGAAEVYIGSAELLARANALPSWGPFPEVITGQRDGQGFAVVRGAITQDVEDLRERLAPGACVAFAWQVATALAVIHEQGLAHGALHPSYVGIDQDRLTIRPALALTLPAEPDPGADAQATDCLHLADVLDALELERLDDPGIPLLLSGMRRERARLRMQPARGVRQALRAILARHPDWVAALVETLGPTWGLDEVQPAPLSPLTTRRSSTVSSGLGAARLAIGGGPRVAPARVAPARIALAPSAPGTSSTPSAPSAPGTASGAAPAVAAAVAASPSVEVVAPSPAAAAPVTTAPEPPARFQVTMVPPEDDGDVISDVVAEEASDEVEAVAAPGQPAASEEESRPPVVMMRMDGGAPPAPDSVDEGPLPAPLPDLAPPESAALDGETDLPTHSPEGPEPDEPTDMHLAPPIPAEVEAEPDPGEEEIPFEVDDEATMVGREELDPSERPHSLGPPPELRSRNLAEEAAAPVPAPAPVPVPAPAPAPLPAPAPPSAAAPRPAPVPAPPQPSEDDGNPRWQGVGGVTGDDSRADELGAGKWQESARSLDEVRKVMDDAPVREMEDLDDAAGGAAWPALAAAAFIVFLLALGWVLFGGGPS